MFKKALFVTLAPALFAGLVGCSSSRDVEVTGEVQGASTGKVYVQFFELTDSKPSVVYDLTLDQAGAFKQKVQLEGDTVLVRAIADADGDQACTAGESWGEFQADITDDKADVNITLAAEPCPSE
jgi:hypothetical protein